MCFIKSLTGRLPDIKSHTKIQAYNFNFFITPGFTVQIVSSAKGGRVPKLQDKEFQNYFPREIAWDVPSTFSPQTPVFLKQPEQLKKDVPVTYFKSAV